MIIAIGGWRGCGATTLSLALASVCANADREVWMIEADPAGGVLSGRVDMDPAAVGGLERVAFPIGHTTPLEGFDEIAHRAGSLRLVSAPVDPFRSHACHRPRSAWVPSLSELGDIVVVDVGRVRAATVAWDVMSIADVVLVVSSAEVASIVSSAEWVHAGGRVSSGDPVLADGVARVCVVDSPGGICFPRSTLVADLGSTCVGWIPWDPSAVDLLHRGAAALDRGFRRGGFMPAVARLAKRLLDTDRSPAEVTS
jgi:hypothetical protein